MSAATIGRLTRDVDPVLFGLLYEPQLADDRRDVLPYLLRIDSAHVVMLARQELLPRDDAAALLALNAEMAQRLAAGEQVLGSPPAHRGLYFLYERECVARLGPQVGGAAHVARSRNDINATVSRMRFRDDLTALVAEGCDLLEAMERVAGRHLETVMCGFTHQQPAQPATLGHYLAGVLSEQTRSVEWLADALAAVDRSPMGAAAGFGTSFPIDTELVARLLGFTAAAENACDAVASRDYVLRGLSALAGLCVSITRLATDLQTWAGVPFGFVGWPDDLVSTSSIMPQKRNPFVLESIRGQGAQVVGALVGALAGMKNVPFANSVEVSQEATSAAWPALRAGLRTVRLMRLLVERMEVFPERMRSFLDDTQATMTAVADRLVSTHGLAFRTAHEALGRLAREVEGPVDAETLVARLPPLLEELLGRRVEVDAAELAACLDARNGVARARFGGGPAAPAVSAQLHRLGAARERVRESVRAVRERLQEAERQRRDAVAGIRDGASSGS